MTHTASTRAQRATSSSATCSSGSVGQVRVAGPVEDGRRLAVVDQQAGVGAVRDAEEIRQPAEDVAGGLGEAPRERMVVRDGRRRRNARR